MKNVLLSLLFICGMQMYNSQAYEGPGDMKINAGLSMYGYGSGISGSLDIGILDWLSVGGGTDIYFRNKEYTDKNFYVYGRGNFHLGEVLGLPENWDVYPGLNIGILGDLFRINGHIGARYFFNDTWGLYTEIGNHGTIGVAINL